MQLRMQKKFSQIALLLMKWLNQISICAIIVSNINAQEIGAPLWKATAVIHPSIIVQGEIVRGEEKILKVFTEQNGERKLIQKFININIKLQNQILFRNESFNFTSSEIISRLSKNEVVLLKNAYVRGGSDEKTTITTIAIDEISGKKQNLVISRRIIGSLDFYVLEGIATDKQVQNFVETNSRLNPDKRGQQ
jgi:hypothetical protein